MSLVRPRAREERVGPDSLLELCVKQLVAVRHLLGDVGWVPAPLLRRVLEHCSRAELESIEDGTLAGSGRDLAWLTWDLWFPILRSHGEPRAGEERPPLPGNPPADYSAPPGDFAQPADYRAMLVAREAAVVARRDAAKARLRAAYQQEAASRQTHGVEYTTKLPPAKRARFNATPAAQHAAAAAAALAGRTLGGKPASTVLKALGLGPSSRPATARHGSSSGFGRGGSSSSNSGSHRPGAGASPHKQQQQRPAVSPHNGRPPSAAAAAAGGGARAGRGPAAPKVAVLSPAPAAAAAAMSAGAGGRGSRPAHQRLLLGGSSVAHSRQQAGRQQAGSTKQQAGSTKQQAGGQQAAGAAKRPTLLLDAPIKLSR